MSTLIPPHLVRQGWASEEDRHREGQQRALEAAARHLAQALSAAQAGSADPHALRQLVTEAAEADRHGAAVTAIARLRFALPAAGAAEQPPPPRTAPQDWDPNDG
ncbi:hypothetical protein SAMN05421812_12810 [Asanoa hainanensis]|uniref:Uncharacterized protein n=2 Tax=Asanoa TaxID=195964 RepID=A0A239PH10_9ACTN|nr:hypothetical protein SAMN05421812_12810 [Asanoa hainanensis]